MQQCYCYPCLDVETKIAEMVVAEFSGRTLRTLSFVNSGEVVSDEICF